MIDRTIVLLASSDAIASMNERSIFTSCTGSRFR
jgi:hypothetical protein